MLWSGARGAMLYELWGDEHGAEWITVKIANAIDAAVSSSFRFVQFDPNVHHTFYRHDF